MKSMILWLALMCTTAGAFAMEEGRDEADVYFSYNPPYSYFQSIQGQGIIIDLALAAMQDAGIKYKLHTGSWSETENWAAKNPKGVFIAGTYRGDRLKIFEASHPLYMVTHQFYKKSGTPYEFTGDLEDLHGLRIGVLKGWEYQKDFMEATYLDKVGFVDTTMALVALYSGEIDLLASDQLMTDYILTHQMPTIKYEIGSAGILDSSPIYLLINKYMPNKLFSRKAFNEALDRMLRDGTLDEIKSKYLEL